MPTNNDEAAQPRAANGKDKVELTGDSDAALAFLQHYAHDGPWTLSAIDPERKEPMITQTFDKPAEALAFIKKWNGERNLYFAVNRLRARLSKKATKKDVGWVNAYHTDVDPNDPPEGTTDHEAYYEGEQVRIREKIQEYDPPPSVVLFSGGGFQCFWLTHEAVEIEKPTAENKEPWAQHEARNKKLEDDLTGGKLKCFNIDRIMRLPGTVNLPNEHKINLGRKKALAYVASSSWELRYSPDDFQPYEEKPKQKAKAKPKAGDSKASSGAKPAADKDWVERVLKNGPDAEGKRSYGGDRSSALWAVILALMWRGLDDEDIVERITDKANKISDHIYEQKNSDPRKVAERQVAKAREKFNSPDETIESMNGTHAVLPIGDKTRVVTFGELEEFPGRRTIVMTQTFGDFKALQDKYRVKYMGEDKSIGRGTHWLKSPHRLQYDGGMAFMPRRDEKVVGNKLNLWTGFGVEAVKPDGQSGAAGCKLFLDFARDVICDSDEAVFDFLIKREATIIQKRTRTEIALALHSPEEGVGKGFYERHMGYLLGKHAMQVNNPKHVIGAFNPHLETLLRLTADEALFVGNHEHRNALFGLVTEGKLTIEPKGLGVYSATNNLNVSLTSNAVHFIPVSGTARRFLVPTVSPKHMQDRPYFRAIENQLVNEGGYQALLYHLLHEVDLRDFDVGVAPRTVGLAEQAAYGRRGIEGLVEQVCHDGRVPCEHHTWEGFTVTSGEEERTGFYHYINMHNDREIKGKALMVVRRLGKEWGCTTGIHRRESGTEDRTRGFSWPDLSELRARFEERFGKQAWHNPDVTAWSVPGEQEQSSGARTGGERITKILKVIYSTEAAIKVGEDPDIWLPLSQIDIEYLGDGRCAKIGMPLWLAKKHGMEAWADAEVEEEIPFPTDL